jgi:hypothetical protein
MTDSNRPVAFEVVDTETKTVIAKCETHAQAFALCDELEPDDGESRGPWRYSIEPVRASSGKDD